MSTEPRGFDPGSNWTGRDLSDQGGAPGSGPSDGRSRNDEKLRRLERLFEGQVKTVRADLIRDRERVTDLIRQSEATILAAGVDPGSLEKQG